MSITATVNLATSANQYYAGNTIGFVATFVDTAAGAINPDDVVFTLTNSYGVQTNYRGTSLAVGPLGTFSLAVLCNVVGVWCVRAACSNPSVAAATTTFNIVAQAASTPGTVPEPLDQVAALPFAGTLNGTETVVGVQANNPVQISAAQFAALISPLSAVPFAAAGQESGFVIGLDGAVHLAPIADVSRLTYPNIASAACALGMV